MWESLQELDPTIAAVSTLLVTFSIAVLGASFALQRIGKRRATRTSELGALTLAPGASEEAP